MGNLSRYVYTDPIEMWIKEIKQGIVSITNMNTTTTTNRYLSRST